MVSQTKIETRIEQDTLPQVTFDIGLGKKLEYIDFDYQAYADHLAERGVSSEAAGQTDIHFEPSKFRLQKGRFSPIHNRMEVFVPGSNPEERVNKNIAHETRHKVDYDKGDIEKWMGMTVVQNVLTPTGLTLMVGAIPVQAAWNVLSDPKIDSLSHYSSVGMYAAGAAALGTSFVLDRLNPLERRARADEKQNETKFVTIVPKK